MISVDHGTHGRPSIGRRQDVGSFPVPQYL
jgi:hypothetical protein